MQKRRYFVLFRNPRSGASKPAAAAGGPSQAEMQQMLAAYKTWMEKFKAEIVDMGDKLKADGRVVTASEVTDGPFIEAKELVGGYMIVSAESYEAAIKVVRACPAIDQPGISLEIREMVGAKM